MGAIVWSLGGAVITVALGIVLIAARLGADRPGSALRRAEAALTLLDGFLASVMLLALVLTAGLGWWRADPIAAAALGLVALHDAREHWEESGEAKAG